MPVTLLGRSSFSQCEIFVGSVEMITSSKPRRLIASSIAAIGSVEPTMPSTGAPAASLSAGHGLLEHRLGLAAALILGVDDLVQARRGVGHEQRELGLAARGALANGVEQRLRGGRPVGHDENSRGTL